MMNRGLLLTVAVAGAVCALAALCVTAIARAQRNARVTSCASNLRHLWAMEMNYAIQFGGTSKAMPESTGMAFWRTLSTTRPPLMEAAVLEIYLCPLRKDDRIGDIHYLGPAVPVRLLAGGAPVGCDVPGNHPEGGNVLRKSGDVLEYLPRDFDHLLRGPDAPTR